MDIISALRVQNIYCAEQTGDLTQEVEHPNKWRIHDAFR